MLAVLTPASEMVLADVPAEIVVMPLRLNLTLPWTDNAVPPAPDALAATPTPVELLACPNTP
jgi:hypothetical protein